MTEKKQCPQCEGSGDVDCLVCNGMGTTGLEETECENCCGDGVETCDVCNGYGDVDV